MANIVKPNLQHTGGNVQIKTYGFNDKPAEFKEANVMHEVASSKETVLPKYESFEATIINPELHDVIIEQEGKVESLLSKYHIFEDVEEQTPNRNPRPGDPDFVGPIPKEEPKKETPKEEPKKEESKKEEPKKEEKPKEEPKKEETQSPVTKPGQNAQLTNELNNRRNELKTGNGVSNQVRTDCNSYAVGGGNNENHYAKDGQLSAKERELLIYLAYHEAGGDPVQATAVMSAYLNGWEKSGYSFNKYMSEACSKWSVNDEFAYATQSYRNGTYTLSDVTSMKKYKELQQLGYYDTLNSCVDNVLAGTRNVNATQWNGNGVINTYTHAA